MLTPCHHWKGAVVRRVEPNGASALTTVLLKWRNIDGVETRSVLVPMTLPLGELIHAALVARAARGSRIHCPELTGCAVDGRPLALGNGHAHVLPVDLDGDGRLDHIIVYAPIGLGDAAQRAIRTLRRTWTKGGVGDLQVALAGSGDIDMLRSLPAPLNQRVAGLLGPSGGSRSWVSMTPFVPPRFLKPRGANTLIGQVNAELTSRQLSAATTIEVSSKGSARLRHFARRRQRGGTAPPVDMGISLRLQFSAPVVGPISLGYSSHFGLGLFNAELSQ